MAKKTTIWIFGIIFFILAYFISAIIYIKYDENKRNDEIHAKNLRQYEIAQNFYKSKLFGIQINQQADNLLFSLQNIAASYGNIGKVFDDTGMLKKTERYFLTGSGYSVQLNDFINDVGIEEQRQFCIDLYNNISKTITEEDCLRPINKNEDFSDYYIKYHPKGYRISSIIGKLKKLSYNKNQCVENLRPYANILSKTIKDANTNERITIQDNFYPSESKPIIYFNYKSEFTSKNLAFITIEGYCEKTSAYISLNAPFLQPNFMEFQKFEKQIKETKKINVKKSFEEKTKEQEKSIDTKGLQ